MKITSAAFAEYFQCPEVYAEFEVPNDLSGNATYFQFEDDLICYGRAGLGSSTRLPDPTLPELRAGFNNSHVHLPLYPDEVANNQRLEHYAASHRPSAVRNGASGVAFAFYYMLRPWMSVPLRRQLQRIYSIGSRNVAFPRWPNDTTADDFLSCLLRLVIQNRGHKIPFIWFWPNGAGACLALTHDVESQLGYQFCSELMGLDEQFGFRSSFQLVPEDRYRTSLEFVREIKQRSFEVNIHDFNHDGHLFRDWNTFSSRAPKIRKYAEAFEAKGFRSAIMYRNPEWLPVLGFEYDMSIPNAAHLDPQRGGCCTLFPFFINDVLELPLTTIQDYALLHILNTRSIELWQRQTELIFRRHGLATFLVHPDYIVRQKDQDVYVRLLAHLRRWCDDTGVWSATPQEINNWWRARRDMRLVSKGNVWSIEGPQRERARLAFAGIDHGQLKFELADSNVPVTTDRLVCASQAD